MSNENTEQVEKDFLTNDEFNALMEFTSGLYNAFTQQRYYSDPMTLNQNLLELNNNQQKPTKDSLSVALQSVPYDYGKLASYSEFMEIWDSIYAKTLRYFEGLLSFDLSYICKNIKNPSEYSSKEYKDDVRRVNKFLDNFDYKTEFKKVLKEILRKETSYVWFRDTHEINNPIDIEEDGKIKKNEKFSLQIMPQKYCMLTGYFNCSQLLYDFNIDYFSKGNVDINLFAPSLKKKYKESFENNDDNYIPSSQLDRRNGVYANWVQCSPNDGAYAFKFDLSNFRQVPPFVNLLKSCLGNDNVEQLQQDKDLISAYLLLAGEIGTLSTEKSGNKADQFKIKPKTIGQFLSLVNSGLRGNSRIKPIALPLEDIKGWQYNDQNPNMVSTQYKTVASQGASASSLIYSTEKMAQFELENAIYADYNFIKPLYQQFNQFLNFYINKKTVKYKFEFTFTGLDRNWDRKERQEALRNYADKGIVLDSTMWASALGVAPQIFQRSLECAHNDPMFIGNLTMMLNANTMKSSGEDNDVGRPQKEGLEKSDGTEVSQNYD